MNYSYNDLPHIQKGKDSDILLDYTISNHPFIPRKTSKHHLLLIKHRVVHSRGARSQSMRSHGRSMLHARFLNTNWFNLLYYFWHLCNFTWGWGKGCCTCITRFCLFPFHRMLRMGRKIFTLLTIEWNECTCWRLWNHTPQIRILHYSASGSTSEHGYELEQLYALESTLHSNNREHFICNRFPVFSKLLEALEEKFMLCCAPTTYHVTSGNLAYTRILFYNGFMVTILQKWTHPLTDYHFSYRKTVLCIPINYYRILDDCYIADASKCAICNTKRSEHSTKTAVLHKMQNCSFLFGKCLMFSPDCLKANHNYLVR